MAALQRPAYRLAPVPGSFYGMNGHADYRTGAGRVDSEGNELHETRRSRIHDDRKIQIRCVKLAQAFQSAGLTLLVLIGQGVWHESG